MIHQYKLHGFNIVLDVASGAIHVVDEVAYDMIALYEAHTREQVLSEIRARYEGQDGITAEDMAAFDALEANAADTDAANKGEQQ
jgi:uncharacterized protein